MTQWDHLVVEYTHYYYGPYQINLWPPGKVNLDWVTQQFHIKINKALVDQIEMRRQQPEIHGQVWMALVEQLGQEGWELVSVDGKMWYFRRARG